jgi:ubiquinone/menaquinone biosynthesis C-methylase UbiE
MSNFWKKIWDTKGASSSSDLFFLDGYDHMKISFNERAVCRRIADSLSIQPFHSILEVGCGCGLLAKELDKHCNYTGVDYSVNIIKKHQQLFPKHEVKVAEANKLPFEDNFFDFVFCFGVFQYLPDEDYANRAISEMQRVAKSKVFLGDLKTTVVRETHFVYPQKKLLKKSFVFSKCLYVDTDTERYNATWDKSI